MERGSAASPLRQLAVSWELSLRAQNKASDTQKGYLGTIRRLLDYWEGAGGPRRARDVTREDCEHYLAHLFAAGLKAGSVATYHKGMRQFFAWLLEEDEIPASPMALVKRPIVPDEDAAPPVLTAAEIGRLYRVCEGNVFMQRRDLAMLRLMFSDGLRHGELIRLQVDDLDFTEQLVTVHRKMRRMETLPLSAKTAMALDRYLRVRALHKYAASNMLWLGRSGPLAYGTLWRIVDKRGQEAGLGHIWPHVLRHTFASHWLEAGGQEGDLMHLAGWRSRTMLGRYGRRMAQQRAKDAHKRLAPGDDL